MASRTPSVFLALAAFVVGMGVMAIEITASRLLAPYFGASLFVWTSLIVTVLLAMSVGYWFGGIAAERGHGMKALGMILSGAAILLLGGVLVVGNFSRALTGIFVAWTNASFTLFVGSLSVSFIVFALPVFLLASAGPIILKEWSKIGGDVGRTAGRYFAVSTFGSVIGTLIPTLLLVPTIGAKGTVEVFAVVFLLLGAVLLSRNEKKLLAFLAIPALGLSMLGGAPGFPGLIMQKESAYQLIRVAAGGSARYLLFNEGSGVQSVYDPESRRDDLFYFDYAAILPLLRPYDAATHKVAIIGLAGGSVARAYFNYLPPGTPKGQITGVEVDPDVITIAKKYFALDELNLRVVNEDGRMFLARTKERYDVIVVDAYSTQVYIPPHMATEEFYALAKSKLKIGGILVMNVNAPSKESRLLKALTNSVAPSFGNVKVIPVSGFWNQLVLASDGPLDLETAGLYVPAEDYDIRGSMAAAYDVRFDPAAEIFTDDRAPVEMLTDSMVLGEVFKRKL